VRAAELKLWAESRDYQRIMDGHYPRRTTDKDTSVSDSLRESAAHYAESVRTSKDPLMKLVGDIAGGAGDLGGKLRDKFMGNGGPAGTGSGSGPAGGTAGGGTADGGTTGGPQGSEG
jgi:hypothetical protein